ncbi:MAG: protein of unknown function with transrane region [Parcubacteria group bacterium]|nr:protein of unknown function with transrane region [Parcubacteria group bacterium]
MEPKFQSSFIPKGPMAAAASFSPGPRKQSKSLLGFLGKVIFILAVIGAVGVFAYSKYLESSIDRKGADLEAARATLEPETIKELTRLNARMTSTKELLAKHTVMSPLLDYLETSTVRNVRFTSFQFAGSDKGLSLTMKGQARGYAAVALQAETFNQSKYFKIPIFSDLALDEKGNVVFSFKGGLDPTVVSYKKQLESGTVELRPLSGAVATSTPALVPVQPVTTATGTSASTTPKR